MGADSTAAALGTAVALTGVLLSALVAVGGFNGAVKGERAIADRGTAAGTAAQAESREEKNSAEFTLLLIRHHSYGLTHARAGST